MNMLHFSNRLIKKSPNKYYCLQLVNMCKADFILFIQSQYSNITLAHFEGTYLSCVIYDKITALRQ